VQIALCANNALIAARLQRVQLHKDLSEFAQKKFKTLTPRQQAANESMQQKNAIKKLLPKACISFL